jgi:hypothetical protein
MLSSNKTFKDPPEIKSHNINEDYKGAPSGLDFVLKGRGFTASGSPDVDFDFGWRRGSPLRRLDGFSPGFSR